MAQRYSRELLRSVRNDLPIDQILELLQLPTKRSEGQLRFLCPRCGEFHTATKASTNLARCFRCKENFNPIDLVMIVERRSFVEAVDFLLKLRERARQLPPDPT